MMKGRHGGRAARKAVQEDLVALVELGKFESNT